MHDPISQSKFEKLLGDVESAYKRSRHKDNRLYYSLIATPLQQGKPLLLGINWGGSGEGFSPQGNDYFNRYPDSLKEVASYVFIQRTKDYAKQIGLDLDKPFNYSNLCFFRTRTAGELSVQDIMDCAPILKELVEYLNPPLILSLGTSIVNYLPSSEIKEDETISKARMIAGSTFGRPHVMLPHPNAKVTNEAREGAWQRAGRFLQNIALV